jgi:lysophospholipase L1-like esterase
MLFMNTQNKSRVLYGDQAMKHQWLTGILSWTILVGFTAAQQAVYISEKEMDTVQKNQKQADGTGLLSAQVRELNVREGLGNFFAKVKAGREVTVGYFGGSITAHPGWRVQTHEWLQKQFPNTKINMLPASVGGTGSLVGVFRADDDLVRHKPDLVFVEFSVNDGGDARNRPNDVLKALEGIFLKLWQSKPDTDICMVYTMGEKDVDTIRQGHYHQAAALHEKIADYYSVPSIYVAPAVVDQIDNGRMVFTGKVVKDGKDAEGRLVLTEDKVHPVIPTGHQVYADVVCQSLKKMESIPEVKRKLPKPMFSDNWVNAKTLPAEGNVLFKGAWQKLTAQNGPSCFRFGKKVYEWFPYLYQTETPGSSVTVQFKGRLVGVKGFNGPDSGVISIKIDDRNPVRECLFTAYSKSVAYIGSPLEELPDGLHTVTWTLLDEKPDKGKILASYWKADNDRDYRENPGKYKDCRFSIGQILLLGELVVPKSNEVEPTGQNKMQP